MKKELLCKFILLVFSISIFSCKEDKIDKPVSFPHTMYVDKITSKSDLKLFSNKSEITDVITKTNFVSNVPNFDLLTQPLDPTENITFVTQDTIIFSSSTIKFAVEKSGDQYLFYSDFFYADITFKGVVYDLLRFNYPKTPLPSASGFQYKTKEVRVAHGDYTDLQLSVLSYKIKQGNSWESETLFNEFNDSVISEIGLNDTLAVREFIIYLKSK